MVAAKPQAKVVDRDGFEVMECVRGDQYIHDMGNTKVSSSQIHLSHLQALFNYVSTL